MEKKLLIIKPRPHSLKTAETFLQKRDWDLRSVTQLKEAIQYLIEERPDFVMISIEHPNRKIGKLIRILPQVIPCCIIPFAETSDANSFQKLTECAQDYTVFPPATGPAIERTILRYIKDLESGKIEKPQTAAFATKEGGQSSGLISIRGENQAQQLLTQILGEESDSTLDGFIPAPGSSKIGSPEKNDSPDSSTRLGLFEKGAESAFEGAVSSGLSGAAVEKLEITTSTACLTVNSERFSGYLVAAMGKDRQIDPELLRQIRERLYKFLRENGEVVSNEEVMNIQIEPVPFEDWALATAEFMKKSFHKDNEIAMAFFPQKNVKGKVSGSSDHEMVAIHIDDLYTDVEIEFNLYLYLPANQKYILYTPCGSRLYLNQKEKLKRQGVSHMHILLNDLQDFHKYRAQGFLNTKVGEYQRRLPKGP